MKNFFTTTFLTLLILVAFAVNSNAQYREVHVPPLIVGALNVAIEGDTTDRTDDTWYVLENGTESAPAIYVLSATIQNRVILNIKAEGPGDRRPIIIPELQSGGVSFRPFRARDDLTLVGLYVTGKTTGGTFNPDQRIIRVSADGARITLDNCWLDYDSQSGLRLDNTLISVFARNSIISNIGTTLSLDNGRFIDARGNLVDTVWVENTRIYNITSRIFRNGGGGATVYSYWNHNTLINSGQDGVTIDQVGTAIFTNNLIINGSYFGQDTVISDGSIGYFLELDPIDSLLIREGITEQNIVINNNNYYLDPAIASLYPGTNSVDGRMPTTFLDSLGQAAVDAAGTGSTIINEDVGIIDGPVSQIALTTAVLDTSLSGPDYPPVDNPDPTPPAYEFNLMYSQSSASFTGGVGDYPLGNLTQWADAGIVGVDDEVGFQFPSQFELMNNYPNPFNPSTVIRFHIAQETDVKLTVINSLGQQVATLTNEHYPAGIHSVTWNAVDDNGSRVSSGVYFYQISTETQVMTKKMIFMK
jgi:hypothetical protein